MTDANTLTPCPFCGERAETDFIPEHHSYQVECSDVFGCTARVTRDSELGAVEAWNLRAPALAAPAQAGEYPPLVCDYCGALTPDPWHSSGMLHGKMSKHIHSCDVCAARGAAQAAPAQAARAGWNACLRNLFSLTDQTGDEAAARETSEFMRGRVFEAKGVARAMNSFGPEHCDDLQAYFTPPAAPVDADVQKQDEALIWLMLVALEHHTGQTRPIARTDDAITAALLRLNGKP